jgi:two-component system, NarL family, sensor histidine kinase UhpB
VSRQVPPSPASRSARAGTLEPDHAPSPPTRTGRARSSRGTQSALLRPRSLFWRVLVINATILIVAALLLALTPFTIRYPMRPDHALALAGGVLVSVLANALLLRYGLAPLENLKTAMHEADPLQPGQRLPETEGAAELNAAVGAFNDMLTRLESERRRSAIRATSIEEEQRRRLSRELHDEIGQRLTAVLLYLKRVAATDEALRPQLVDAQIEIRTALNEVRRVLRELLPQVLEELGLVSALAELANGFSAQTAVPIDCDFPETFPRLVPAQELAVYRIAQEALTNVARHADGTRASISLSDAGGALTLVVADDGVGPPRGSEAGGIRGMRERAIQIRGVLTLGESTLGGTELRLVAPLVLAEEDR